MLSNFRILIEMRNRSFMFFYSGLKCSVGLAIIHKVAIVATDSVNDSVVCSGGDLSFGLVNCWERVVVGL